MTNQLVLCTALPPFDPSAFAPPDALEAVGIPSLFWKPGSSLKVHFQSGDDALKRRVADIASEWCDYANLKFEFYYDPAKPPLRYRRIRRPFGGYIRIPDGLATDISITFWEDGGGKSNIGSGSRQVARTGHPSMHLPLSGDTRVVLHEFGHALGLHHEHLSPSAGIKWNVPAVYEYYRVHYGWTREDVDNNVLSKLSATITNYTEFDPASIMLYAIPAELTLDGFSTGWNRELSATDKAFIARAYPR